MHKKEFPFRESLNENFAAESDKINFVLHLHNVS